MSWSSPRTQLDISDLSVEDGVRRLLRRYGAEQVKEAVKRQTARPRGHPPIADWPELAEILREDAHLWLNGGEPFSVRSNRSIALKFAKKFPGHSFASTRDRMMRKLRERRRYYTLVEAEWLSQDQYPYTENLRAIGALCDTGKLRDSWDKLLCLREGSLVDYRAKFGEPPANMTMQELVAEAGTPILPTQPANVFQALMGSNRNR